MNQLVGVLPFFLAELLFFTTHAPTGLESVGYHYALLFAATIGSILLQRLQMSVSVLLGMMFLVAHRLLPLNEALSGFGHPIAWLVVSAFMVARAVIDCGLGRRIALGIMSWAGSSVLGLGYGLFFSEMVLGALIPSSTARGGGIVAPVVDALAKDLERETKGDQTVGAYLFLVATAANIISSTTFLTAMVGNPLVVQAAMSIFGVAFTWTDWFLGALLPTLCSVLFGPLILRWVSQPQDLDLGRIQKQLREKRKSLGAITKEERRTIGVLLCMVIGWVGEGLHGHSTTMVTLLGVVGLMLAKVATWQNFLRETKGWDALVWLGGLITLGEGLRAVGAVRYLVGLLGKFTSMFAPLQVFVLVMLIYFYSMYIFSVATAHILAFAAPVFGLLKGLELPVWLVVPAFAYLSNLCVCLTNYSTGPVVIFYGYGYVPLGTWFRVGAVMSVWYLSIWLGVGPLWWKVLGWW